MDGSAEDTSGGRSLKRRRIEEENDTQTSTSLPSEVLGNIMNFLDYNTVLSCAATSKSFLHAMSLITELHIDKSSQLNALNSRYRDVRVINICSLLCMEGEGDNTILMVDNETLLKVIPFLCHFTKLEKVFLGGKDGNGKKFGVGEYMGTRYSFPTPEGQRISNLMMQISYSFQSNFLPSRLLVLGIRCPLCCSGNNREGSSCPCCQLACKTWPLEHVINFNNKGSSRLTKNIFEQRRLNTLDVCLTRDQLETIVKGRSGGEEMLCPERRLLHLLGDGRPHIIRSDDDGSSFYIVKFYQKEGVDKLKEEVTKLNGKQISKEEVTNAIMNSFSMDGSSIPPKSRCYLGRNSSLALKEIGLPVLNEALVANNKNLPHLIKVLMADGVPAPLISECFYLLGLIVKQEGNISAVQHVVDSGLLPLMINKYLNSTEITMHTKRNIIITLTSMTRRSTSLRDYVLKADLVVPLTTLSEKKSAKLSKDVAGLIYTLCQGEPRPDFVLVEPYLSIIPSILLVYDEKAVRYCGKALLVLCELNDQRSIDSTCKMVVESLGNTVEVAKFNAMMCILLNHENEAVLDHLMNSDMLSIVVPLMPNSRLNSLASAIGCIVSKKYARQVVSQGCIHIFFGLLISSDHDTVKYSVIALLRILEFGREEGDQSITSVICSGLSLIETKLGELDFSMGYKLNITEEEVQMYKKNMPVYKAL